MDMRENIVQRMENLKDTLSRETKECELSHQALIKRASDCTVYEIAHNSLDSDINDIRRHVWEIKNMNDQMNLLDLLLQGNTEQVKTFWAVSRKYFDSGAVKVNLYPVKDKTKPESGKVENNICDHYVDYFDTQEEASAWTKKAEQA